MTARRPPAVVHVDLDGATAIYAVHGWEPTFERDSLFATGLANALDFFDARGVKATFFAIAADLDDPLKRPLIEEAVRRGHEIGSHSATHPPLTTLTSEQKRAEIVGSRERLESALDVPVTGFRAPQFDIDAECVRLAAEAGYRFDSSVFPNDAFAERMEGKRPDPGPHRPFGEGGVLELPLPAHAPLPFPFHPCYSLVLGRWYFRMGLGRFHRTGRPLVLLFHLTDFAEPVPDRFLLGLKSRLFTLSHLGADAKLRRCKGMLERVERHYELMTTTDLLDHLG